jgi:hypothetical protein
MSVIDPAHLERTPGTYLHERTLHMNTYDTPPMSRFATHRKYYSAVEPRFDRTWQRLSDSGDTRRYLASDDSGVMITYIGLGANGEDVPVSGVLSVHAGAIALVWQDPTDGVWVLDIPRSDPYAEIVSDEEE